MNIRVRDRDGDCKNKPALGMAGPKNGTLGRTPTWRLLKSQCVNGIELRSLVGGVEAEDHADEGRDADRHDD